LSLASIRHQSRKGKKKVTGTVRDVYALEEPLGVRRLPKSARNGISRGAGGRGERPGAASLSRTLFRRRTDAEFLGDDLPRDKRFVSVFYLCLGKLKTIVQVLDGFQQFSQLGFCAAKLDLDSAWSL